MIQNQLKKKAKDIITPCVVTNMDVVANIEVLKLNETVDFLQEVAKVKLKQTYVYLSFTVSGEIMNDKKFWKIIYLYITKYNYSILYYRPEKKDVWLINEDNELIRFIYGDSFKSTEIDSIVSNVIRNEVRLKKMFKLSSLKMKILYVSPDFDEVIDDYNKIHQKIIINIYLIIYYILH